MDRAIKSLSETHPLLRELTEKHGDNIHVRYAARAIDAGADPDRIMVNLVSALIEWGSHCFEVATRVEAMRLPTVMLVEREKGPGRG